MSSHPSSLDKFLVPIPNESTFPSKNNFDLFGSRTIALLAQTLYEQLQLQGCAENDNFVGAALDAISLPSSEANESFVGCHVGIGFPAHSGTPKPFSLDTAASINVFGPDAAHVIRELTRSTPSKYPLSFLIDAELAHHKTPPRPPPPPPRRRTRQRRQDRQLLQLPRGCQTPSQFLPFLTSTSSPPTRRDITRTSTDRHQAPYVFNNYFTQHTFFSQHLQALHFLVLSGDSPLVHHDPLHVARDAGENTTLCMQYFPVCSYIRSS